MTLEDYFDFLAPDDIRLKGSRIGIETVLYEHIHRAQTPEQIQQTYPSLSLEQVYATVLYYLHNQEAVTAYLTDWIEFGRRMRAEQERDPHPGVVRLRKLKAELRDAGVTVDQYLHDPAVRERIAARQEPTATPLAA